MQKKKPTRKPPAAKTQKMPASFEIYLAEIEETRRRMERTQQEIDRLGEQTRKLIARLQAA